MTDIRKRLRMLADNAQRSEIVEDAIRLIDRLDGKVNMDLPIKVLSRDEVEVGTNCYSRQAILRRIATLKGFERIAETFSWQKILRRMDEFEEPYCHANNDGDCKWVGCPQIKDGEPKRSGRHCPLDTDEQELLDPNCCAVCGWPLKERMEDGCIRGNCSQRPRPTHLYDECRARAESVMYAKEPTKWEPGMKAMCYSSHHVNPVEFEVRKVVETPGFSHGPVLYAVAPFGSSHDSINCTPVPPPQEPILRDPDSEPLNDQPIEELQPKWEPGMVLVGYLSHKLRLDKHLGGDRWDYLNLTTGRKGTAAFFPETNYTIHRLPHEFKVGDWFVCSANCCKGLGPFQVDVVGDEQIRHSMSDNKAFGEWHSKKMCTPVPPPQEPTNKWELCQHDIRKVDCKECQEQAEGKYRCDLPESRFSGPHWKLADADKRAEVYQAICLCDLRDALLEKEEKQ